jgi:hypothetical protein
MIAGKSVFKRGMRVRGRQSGKVVPVAGGGTEIGLATVPRFAREAAFAASGTIAKR